MAKMKLKDQLRMHPDISNFISMEFYDYKMINNVEKKKEKHLSSSLFSNAVTFIHTNGCEKK